MLINLIRNRPVVFTSSHSQQDIGIPAAPHFYGHLVLSVILHLAIPSCVQWHFTVFIITHSLINDVTHLFILTIGLDSPVKYLFKSFVVLFFKTWPTCLFIQL